MVTFTVARNLDTAIPTVESFFIMLIVMYTCQLSRFSRESPSFSSNLMGKTYRAFFSKLFYQFPNFRGIKKENKTRGGINALT